MQARPRPGALGERRQHLHGQDFGDRGHRGPAAPRLLGSTMGAQQGDLLRLVAPKGNGKRGVAGRITRVGVGAGVEQRRDTSDAPLSSLSPACTCSGVQPF
jgi:hypothetical protein